MKWIKCNHKQVPPHDKELLVKFKHGIITCYFDKEQYEKDKTFVGNAYIWQDFEFYIYEWMLLEDFEKCLDKPEAANE